MELGPPRHRALQPYATGAEYTNFPGFYEDNDRTVRDTFGPNLDRLVALKQRFDPPTFPAQSEYRARLIPFSGSGSFRVNHLNSLILTAETE